MTIPFFHSSGGLLPSFLVLHSPLVPPRPMSDTQTPDLQVIDLSAARRRVEGHNLKLNGSIICSERSGFKRK